MASAETAWKDLGPGLFDETDCLDALAAWLSGERIDAAADAATDGSWIVDDEAPLIDDFLSLGGDAFVFGVDAPAPDAGRAPETSEILSEADPAVDRPGEGLLSDADDGAEGLFAGQPGSAIGFLSAEASGDGETEESAAGAALGKAPDPEGIDIGRPAEITPPTPLLELAADTPAPGDPNLPGEPETVPTDDGGVVSVADLDDGFDFLL